ncbi:cytochrome C-552 [Pontibaca salina]|uniref:Cytochrome C-552 n=1 Tax=Pontibaca salina TaxID=2795731 RepID=A0A934HU04_9RHOB|nr:cytochrome C-552 [Pontibaca salina]MBI6629559.1 cytochrome C-552 [Pontibaca salina]
MINFNILGGAIAAASLFLAAPAFAQTYDPMVALTQSPDAMQADGDAVKLDPELGNLPVGEGAEDTFYQCTACHSTAIITQQRLSDARWDYMWDWMVEDQGMYDPEDETKEIVLNYLKQHFSSER